MVEPPPGGGCGVGERILLCEPQCRGFEHVPFNAALLRTTLLAFPQSRVEFLAERDHLAGVRAQLEMAVDRAGLARVSWEEIEVPPTELLNLRRLPHERRWCRRLAGLASRKDVAALLLCSATNTGLLALKLAVYRGGVSAPVVVVLHSILKTLAAPARRPWNRAIGLGAVLALPEPSNLRYIALGQPIYDELREHFPNLAGRFDVLDHPYLWANERACQLPHDRVRFGFFGSGWKGFDQFGRLAKDVRSSAAGQRAEFELVGFVSDPELRKAYSEHVLGMGPEPLPRDEYDRRAARVDYLVSLADPEPYRFTASGTFLDSLSFVKPGIYVRNPFVEYYVRRMGDVGYLCDGPARVLQKIREILTVFPADHYSAQCRNILRGRKIFEPDSLAAGLRRILARRPGPGGAEG